MLKELIRNTKPEILVSISDEYLDHVGDEPLARYVDLTWQGFPCPPLRFRRSLRVV